MNLSERFDQALLYAADLHRPQIRKGSGIPYMNHLLGVCSMALGYGADEEMAMAALLHDALEDGPENIKRPRVQIEQEIQEKFGPRVLEVVRACTDTEVDTSMGGEKEEWQVRKARYIDHMESATDKGYLLVTCCDKLHNLRSIWQDREVVQEAIWERFTGKKEGSLWYYRELGRVMGIHAEAGRIPVVLVTEYEGLLERM
ncbi:MAG: bifunctional (p)ppGpp synthetase/guanosine-3',5'-bis(diphosphate) 3'-pyrophosphohydrolase [Synechococcaceae cyanobacterium SM2_3_2]|nr:bifunctional (p)ppGpp synthetase/guanosine-3',5'-bis(diphosphate) 3'-pyrophosphohydrolase [Synechococcaceae cyanobacterium SM2_3_2]